MDLADDESLADDQNGRRPERAPHPRGGGAELPEDCVEWVA
jgi:hypothetical protein